MAAMQISSCGSPFAKLVYEQCGEDLGDILTLVRVEVDEAQKRFITHFLSWPCARSKGISAFNSRGAERSGQAWMSVFACILKAIVLRIYGTGHC